MNSTSTALNLKAALLSALLLLALVGVWQLATATSAPAAPAVKLTAEQIEYAKLLGKDPGAEGGVEGGAKSGFPTPAQFGGTVLHHLASPFYDNGPNDKGIGAQVLVSLQRVFSGFALATLVGVPLGFLIGANRRAWKAVNPVVQLLRPVSPLAWYPLGLLVLKNAPGAAVFVIFITALWPTVVNTAAGAASVPADHRNVARVFRLGAPAYVRHVLVPHTLPSVVTGLRLSMGVAWMVIVAVEMLSGGTGIGFFVWNSYNGGNFGNLIAAIVLIGTVGLALDALFNRLARRAVIEEVAP